MGAEAGYWKKLEEDDKIRCELCPQGCVMNPGGRGICKNRGNREGRLVPLIYGRVAAAHVDPIEKKPLYHFCPGTDILSVGFIGCNFKCPFCQNYSLVEGNASLDEVDFQGLINAARRNNSVGIAFTYNEPLVNFEWVMDCAQAFHEAGLRTVAVTNGYINPDPFSELVERIDAFNIDLKYSSDGNYRKYSGAKNAQVVRDNIRTAFEKSHVEVTHLLVTGINDEEDAFTALVDHIAEISPDIPLHISRYHPMYKYREPSTPVEFIEKAYEIAGERLSYVYVGNVHSELGSASKCKNCGNILVIRSGYSTKITGLKGAECAKCGAGNYFTNPC